MMPYNKLYDMNDIVDAANRVGSHFFSKDTMRFFNSRLTSKTRALSDDGYHGMFVISNRPPYGPREYAVEEYKFTQTEGRWNMDREQLGTYHSLGVAGTAMKKLEPVLG